MEALEVTAAALNMVVAVAVVHAQMLHKRAWVVVVLVLVVQAAAVAGYQMVLQAAQAALQGPTQQVAVHQEEQAQRVAQVQLQRALVVVRAVAVAVAARRQDGRAARVVQAAAVVVAVVPVRQLVAWGQVAEMAESGLSVGRVSMC